MSEDDPSDLELEAPPAWVACDDNVPLLSRSTELFCPLECREVGSTLRSFRGGGQGFSIEIGVLLEVGSSFSE